MEQNNSVQTQIMRGEEMVLAGQLPEALSMFENILEQSPRNIQALNDKAVIHFYRQEFEASVSTLLQVLENDSANSDAIHNLVANFRALDAPKAIKMLAGEFGGYLNEDDRRTLFQEEDQDSASRRVAVLKMETTGSPVSLAFELDINQYSQANMWNHFTGQQLYEGETALFLMRALRPGDGFLDIGGHIGYFSLLASELVGPEGAVCTFEPSAINFAQLLQNISRNQKQNIEVYNCALGKEKTEKSFFINLDNDGGHALWDVGRHEFNQNSRRWQVRKKMRVESLDGLLSDSNRSWRAWKLDVEGSELDVLRGGESLLRDAGVPFVICEINRFALHQMGTSEEELRNFMYGLGYESYCFTGEGPKVLRLPPGQYVDSQFVFNLLFSTDAFLGGI